jgi:Rrf2 family protein
MKFSTKSTYGIRAMINLAKNSGGDFLSLAKIAEEEKISLGYLERLFSKLKKAGLVKSERGVKGGYSLTRKPEDISILDIVKTLEGNISYFRCVSEDGLVSCDSMDVCGAVKVLSRLQKVVNDTLVNFENTIFEVAGVDTCIGFYLKLKIESNYLEFAILNKEKFQKNKTH